MNCPHCDQLLKTYYHSDNDDVYHCFNKDHHYSIKLSNQSIYIVFYNEGNESIQFNNFFINQLNYIEDFSMFKGKTFEEIKCFYNKMAIFK